MALIYRHHKNAPLTIEELDGNFQDLDQRLKRLEDTAGITEPIHHCIQQEKTVHLVGASGKTLASFDLPIFTFTARGEWKKEENYFYGDLITCPGQIFYCIKNHVATDLFKDDVDAGHWQIFIDILSILSKK